MAGNRKDRRAANAALKSKGGSPPGSHTLDALMSLAFKVQAANSVFAERAHLDVYDLPPDIAEIVMTRSYLLSETATLFSAIGCLMDERRLAAYAGNQDFESVRRDLEAILDIARLAEQDQTAKKPLDYDLADIAQMLDIPEEEECTIGTGSPKLQ